MAWSTARSATPKPPKTNEGEERGAYLPPVPAVPIDCWLPADEQLLTDVREALLVDLKSLLEKLQQELGHHIDARLASHHEDMLQRFSDEATVKTENMLRRLVEAESPLSTKAGLPGESGDLCRLTEAVSASRASRNDYASKESRASPTGSSPVVSPLGLKSERSVTIQENRKDPQEQPLVEALTEPSDDVVLDSNDRFHTNAIFDDGFAPADHKALTPPTASQEAGHHPRGSRRSVAGVVCKEDSLAALRREASATMADSGIVAKSRSKEQATKKSNNRQWVSKILKEHTMSFALREPLPSITDLGVYDWCVNLARRIIAWKRFEFLMGFIILINSICIGVETQAGVEVLQRSQDPHASTREPELLARTSTQKVLNIMEDGFLAIYTWELCVRLLAKGRDCWKDQWFCFDALLVAAGFTSALVLKLVVAGGRQESANLLSNVMVFRAGRLLRMLRALRMVQQFRPIWKLVYGLLNSCNTMVSTLFLVALVLYVFACLGVELITKEDSFHDDEELDSIVQFYFTDLFMTLLFLFQFITLDSVASVYVPLIKAKPFLAFYFLSLLLVVSISLMNLVMAKIVEGALDAAKQDCEIEREQRKDKIRNILPVLIQIFDQLDSDDSGKVELQELEDLQTNEMPQELLNLIQVDNMRELLEILDVDDSGEVSQDEFIDGILQLHISEVPVQTVQMLKLLRIVREKVDDLDSQFAMMGEQKSTGSRMSSKRGSAPSIPGTPSGVRLSTGGGGGGKGRKSLVLPQNRRTAEKARMHSVTGLPGMPAPKSAAGPAARSSQAPPAAPPTIAVVPIG